MVPQGGAAEVGGSDLPIVRDGRAATQAVAQAGCVTDLADVEYEDGVTGIPDTPFYVVTLDTFYSGWGPACDRDVFNVFPCQTRDQAELVATTARQPLISQTDVMILDHVPATAPDRVLVIRSPARVADWASMED